MISKLCCAIQSAEARREHTCSGRLSYLPSKMPLKPWIVSFRSTYLPAEQPCLATTHTQGAQHDD